VSQSSPEGAQSPEKVTPDASDELCGYAYEASTMPDLGGICCVRPCWGDTDRCVWHAEVGQKPTSALEEMAPRIGERLDGAVFRDVELSGVDWLVDRTLVDAQFVDTNLEETDLSRSDLRHAKFENADAQRTIFRRANLEHAEFSRSDLRGADLAGARISDAVFPGTRIDEATAFGDRLAYEDELAADDAEPGREQLYEVTRASYRELQRLAADSGLAEDSREYYLKQADLRRRLAWERGTYARALGTEAWRWTTRYGTSPWRVVATSGAVIAVCAMLYPLTGGIQESTAERTITYSIEDPESAPRWLLVLVFFKSLYFSTVTFATLGYGDIQPVGSVARALAGLEALAGQLLVALLVFVLTRIVTWSE